MVVELLLVMGAAATGLCFVRGYRGLGFAGVLGGVLTFGVYLFVGSAMESALPGLVAGVVYASAMTLGVVARGSRGGAEAAPPTTRDRRRRAFVGGLIGIVPGVLVMVVPLVLHAMGIITSDQSQAGFLGIFLIPAGLLAGAAVGALTRSGSSSDDTPIDARA